MNTDHLSQAAAPVAHTQLFTPEGVPQPAFAELLGLFGIDGCQTVEDVRDATQREWYVQGKLRAEIQEQHGQHRERAITLLRQLGFFDAVRAAPGRYDEAIVLGATVVAVRKRLKFLIDEWDRGVKFRKLALLGSTRRLLADKESSSVLGNARNAELPFPEDWTTVREAPGTEAEMMEMVLDQAEASGVPWKDEGMITDIFASVPPPGRNATAADTLIDWEATVRRGSRRVIVASSQPFVSSQDAVVRNNVAASREIHTVGPAGGEALPMTVHLDNIAKAVFELMRRPS